MTLPQNFDQKSGFPYLVDIKLTDYCTFGCPFCYQSSTKDGNHADSWWAGRVLADFLFKSNVLEVNFGGGDPTLYKKNHHNLSEIIRHYHSKKFKVGITTKNYKWWKSSNFKESLKYIDSLAISVNSLNEVEDAKKLVSEIQKGSDNYPKIYFQCIHELSSYDDFKKLLVELANFYHSNITLLGYKSFGFGQDKKIHNYPVEWIDFVKNLSDKKSVNIGVDSVLVRNWKEQLIKRGVKEYYLVGTEGKSTCFIDAVKQRIYPSSFSNHEGFPLPISQWDNKNPGILESFRKF